MTKHAMFGASKAHRWLACAGSAKAEAAAPKKPSSVYAQEGTTAHELASLTLMSSPRSFRVARNLWLGTKLKGVIVTDEMCDAVDVYLSWLEEHTAKGDVVWVEQSFSLEPYPEFPLELEGKMFGTADFIRYNPERKELLVADYKHGQGEVVDVEGNPQLLFYALGAVLFAWPEHPVDKIVVAIVQPRARGEAIKTLEVSLLDVMDLGQDFIDAAVQGLKPNAPRVAGDHCHWCAAADTCPALRERALAVTDRLTAVTLDEEPSLEELGKLLALADELESRVAQWAKPLRSSALEKALNGEVIPSWKLVRGRSSREWDGTIDYKTELVRHLGGQAYKPEEVISVAQAEKIIGKKDFASHALAKLVTKKEGNVSLAPESDKRPAVSAASVATLLSPVDLENEDD